MLFRSIVNVPFQGQRVPSPYVAASVLLDGADTGMLHAVDAGSAGAMRSGLRVRPRWAAQRVGHIRDIECFEPVPDGEPPQPEAAPEAAAEPVTMIVTPVRLRIQHSASAEESRYLIGLSEGKVIGQRCPVCAKVYVPPRGACPTDGVPTTTDVELPDVGTVTTFCVVNVPFQGQRVPSPYVAASVLLDGADIDRKSVV